MGSIRRAAERARQEKAREKYLKELAEAEARPKPKPKVEPPKPTKKVEEKKPAAGLKEKISSMVARKSKKKED